MVYTTTPWYGSFVGDQSAWTTAKMYFALPNARPTRRLKRWTSTASRSSTQPCGDRQRGGGGGGHGASALLLKHEFLDGGADDVTLATLGEVLLEPTLTTLGNFLVRSNNSQSSVASASFAVGGFQLEGNAMTLSHRAHLHADAGETLLLWLPVAGHGLQLGDARQRGRQRLRGRHRHLPRHALASGARRA